MTAMVELAKLKKGDRVAVVSPSFAAPGKYPAVYELGLRRLREVVGLEPVEFPTTRMVGATTQERARDLVAAFEDPTIRGVITTIGGNDQVTYVKHIPAEPFARSPKPFFGYSDNSHLANFLWLLGVPCFYGGAIMPQYAMQGQMHDYTLRYLKFALFEGGQRELQPSEAFTEVGLDWGDPQNVQRQRDHSLNDGWFWDGEAKADGITWGGCVECIGEMLTNGVPIPSLEDFEHVVLMMETSEEIPSADSVRGVCESLGKRGILERIRGVLVGRPKAWEFDKPQEPSAREVYRKQQRATIMQAVRQYNASAPIVQNLDFGHTDPQIAMPYGGRVWIDPRAKKIVLDFGAL